VTGDAAAEDDLRIVIQRVSRRIRSNRPESGVGDTQFAVLVHLKERGPLGPSELAGLEKVTPPSMNRTLNALEEDGFVTRTRSLDDARKVVVDLTPAATELMAETRRLRTAWFSRHLAALEPGERDELLRVLPILRKLAEQ
jgi:DNA-binding MarR family transcriptional regulator